MSATLSRSFEKFLGGPTEPADQRVHVTMDKRNVIGLNAKCYQMLGKPPAVYLHFSRADDTIAIEPLRSQTMPNCFPLKRNGSGWYLNAAPFSRHFGIVLDASIRFTTPDFRAGALLLKLSDVVTITRTRRYQRKEASPR